MGYVGIFVNWWCFCEDLLVIKFSVRKLPHRKTIFVMYPSDSTSHSRPPVFLSPCLSGGCPHSRRRTIQTGSFPPRILVSGRKAGYGVCGYFCELYCSCINLLAIKFFVRNLSHWKTIFVIRLTAAHLFSYPLVFLAAVLTVVVGRYKPARFPRILVSGRKAGYGICWYFCELYCSCINLLAIKFFVRNLSHWKTIFVIRLPLENDLCYTSSDSTSHSRRRTIQLSCYILFSRRGFLLLLMRSRGGCSTPARGLLVMFLLIIIIVSACRLSCSSGS